MPQAQLVPVKNTSKMSIYVAGVMIPAGETRHFPKHLVPAHLLPATSTAAEKPAEPEPTAIESLLDNSVKNIIPVLSGLDPADLVELTRFEEASSEPRKTLLAAIAEENLRRAGESADDAS